MSRDCLNIACGDSYVDGWINYDYSPISAAVSKVDILKRLPLEDGEMRLVYSSHFIEHIPKALVIEFLKECFRVLESGGKIRLVLPDLEVLCREYLIKRENEEHKKADFIILELLDQCVRKVSGGELDEYYNNISRNNNIEMIDYIKAFTGEAILVDRSLNFKKNLSVKIFEVIKAPTILWGWMERRYCRLVALLLPSAFLKQNVSFSQVGENHAWVYDFYNLSNLLKEAGFENIKKLNFDKSDIYDFPLYPLDMTEEGLPRKGKESMYVEALKP